MRAFVLQLGSSLVAALGLACTPTEPTPRPEPTPVVVPLPEAEPVAAPAARDCDLAGLRRDLTTIEQMRRDWVPRKGRPFAGAMFAASAVWSSCPDMPASMRALLDRTVHDELGEGGPPAASDEVESLLPGHVAAHSIDAAARPTAIDLAVVACPSGMMTPPDELFDRCGFADLGFERRERVDLVAALTLLGGLDRQHVPREVGARLVDSLVNTTSSKLPGGHPLAGDLLLPKFDGAHSAEPGIVVDIGPHEVVVAGARLEGADAALGGAGLPGLDEAVVRAFIDERTRSVGQSPALASVVVRADRRARADVIAAVFAAARKSEATQGWITGLEFADGLAVAQRFTLAASGPPSIDAQVDRTHARYRCGDRAKPVAEIPFGTDASDDDPAPTMGIPAWIGEVVAVCSHHATTRLHVGPDVPVQTLLAAAAIATHDPELLVTAAKERPAGDGVQ